MNKSRHDKERDYIASNWQDVSPFTCAACQMERQLPERCVVRTEATYGGGLRADLAFLDESGNTLGVIEVIDTHPPTEQALIMQEKLSFAYYRLINRRTSPKRRSWDDVEDRGKFTYPEDDKDEPKWLCSRECLTFFNLFEGADLINTWEAPRCDTCNGYFHANHLSSAVFLDWDNPYYPVCIHCAASVSDGTTQWRSPGELVGGDPREWIPSKESGAESLLLAYCDAAFWAMVWGQRVQSMDESESYTGERNTQAENATAARLPLINAAFAACQWEKGAALLSPIGAPGWAAYPGESERLLAWRSENCRGTAAAWERLKAHRLEQLPLELSRRIPRERLPIYLYCQTHGDYLDYGNGDGCPDCSEQLRQEEEKLRQAEAQYQSNPISPCKDCGSPRVRNGGCQQCGCFQD